METLYRKVKCSDRTPDIEKGCTICHNSQGPMYCWWVPEDKWWENADEYAYGIQEIDWWLEELPPQEHVTLEEINELIQPHAITLEHGEKAAQDIFDLYKERGNG